MSETTVKPTLCTTIHLDSPADPDAVGPALDVSPEDQTSFVSWTLSNLDQTAVSHLRVALHEHFRQVASAPVTDAHSMAERVEQLGHINGLIQALERGTAGHEQPGDQPSSVQVARGRARKGPVTEGQPARGAGSRALIRGRGLGALKEPYPEEPIPAARQSAALR